MYWPGYTSFLNFVQCTEKKYLCLSYTIYTCNSFDWNPMYYLSAINLNKKWSERDGDTWNRKMVKTSNSLKKLLKYGIIEEVLSRWVTNPFMTDAVII